MQTELEENDARQHPRSEALRGAVILDNQIKTVTHVDRISHYKPIFSINRDSWWLHTKPKGNVTVVASSSR